MSGKGGEKLKSDRGVSVQMGRLPPTSWGRGTSASTRHGDCDWVPSGQGHIAGTELQGAWH